VQHIADMQGNVHALRTCFAYPVLLKLSLSQQRRGVKEFRRLGLGFSLRWAWGLALCIRAFVSNSEG
jgi:hypothetical protein